MNTAIIVSIAICVFLLFVFVDFMHKCEIDAGKKNDTDGTVIVKFTILIVAIIVSILRMSPEIIIGALIAIPVKLITTYIYRVVKM